MGDSDFSQLLREQELSPLQDRIRELEEQCAVLHAERKRMLPVIQAAIQCVDNISDKNSLLRAVGPLIDAVDNYQKEATALNLDSRSLSG